MARFNIFKKYLLEYYIKNNLNPVIYSTLFKRVSFKNKYTVLFRGIKLHILWYYKGQIHATKVIMQVVACIVTKIHIVLII